MRRSRHLRSISSTSKRIGKLLEDKAKQLAELPQIDVEKAQAQQDELLKLGQESAARESAVSARIQANERVLRQLRDVLQRTGDIEQRYGRIKLMADAANGNLTGQAKIRFEAYVQGMYFDRVIAAANERLARIDGGTVRAGALGRVVGKFEGWPGALRHRQLYRQGARRVIAFRRRVVPGIAVLGAGAVRHRAGARWRRGIRHHVRRRRLRVA